MKKVLVVTYYWPPGSGAGVFRWMKFCKYLRGHGWEPVIYAPENPESPGHDPTLEKELPGGIHIIRRPIWEPYRFYKLLTGQKKEEKIQSGFLNEHRKPSLSDNLSTWIRGNFFIPDARRFWIRPSARFLLRWLAKNPVEAIVTTGPPHSLHLIGLTLKKKTGIPWLADFRDPWTQIDYHEKLMLSRWAAHWHQRLEKTVLSRADKVTTVSRHCALGLEAIGRRRVEVISNGFDPDDFPELPEFNYERFRITHLGSMNADRNPQMLWYVLQNLVKEDPFFRDFLHIRLTGKTDITVRKSLEDAGLMPFTTFTPPLPHRQALAHAADSAILLLPLNNTPNVMGITTGKLFEYLGLRRPVLCIGPPEGDAARIIRETRSGVTVDFHDTEQCRKTLLEWAARFRKKELSAVDQQIGQYNRKTLTKELAAQLDSMINIRNRQN
ncbi:MAG: glycosyltransferase family 4 protein [Bacteroidales bacterium]